MDKLGHLFDLPIEDHTKLFHLHETGPALITVRDVSYHYHASGDALHGVNFELRPGESLALVGPDGSGKSTLIELVSAIRRPTSGHIELDGIDLRELRSDSLREHMALARSCEIFHGTIDDNVHMNRPHISARDVRQALAAVGLLDDLLQLPHGLDTPLQTNGAPLSSGQAHRLALARAIVGRPRLLLIDGTFDAIADDVLSGILDKLITPEMPWTLVVATGRADVARRCQRVLQLPLGEFVADAA
jgi:ABC-type bacteriocin/lantibiotic exporter with double-glycine peptidase domain